MVLSRWALLAVPDVFLSRLLPLLLRLLLKFPPLLILLLLQAAAGRRTCGLLSLVAERDSTIRSVTSRELPRSI